MQLQMSKGKDKRRLRFSQLLWRLNQGAMIGSELHTGASADDQDRLKRDCAQPQPQKFHAADSWIGGLLDCRTFGLRLISVHGWH